MGLGVVGIPHTGMEGGVTGGDVLPFFALTPTNDRPTVPSCKGVPGDEIGGLFLFLLGGIFYF